MGGKMNSNKKLYKAAFSRLHASETLKASLNEKMEVNIMEGKKFRSLRISRPVIVCAVMAALLCALSVGTFAATGGETANPVTAVKLMLNGQDITSDGNVNADGSVDVKMDAGDILSYSSGEGGSEISVETFQDGGSIHIDKDMNVDITIDDADGKIEDGEPVLKKSYEAKVTDNGADTGNAEDSEDVSKSDGKNSDSDE